MEGYLLVFSSSSCARLCFGVVDSGQIKLQDKRDGVTIASIPLTKHSVRVTALNGGIPNQFVVHTLALKRSDTIGKFIPAAEKERAHVLATTSTTNVHRWSQAVFKWRMQAFKEPREDAAHSERAKLLEDERRSVLQLASRFEVNLLPTPKRRKRRRPSDIVRWSRKVGSKDALIPVEYASSSRVQPQSWLGNLLSTTSTPSVSYL